MHSWQLPTSAEFPFYFELPGYLLRRDDDDLDPTTTRQSKSHGCRHYGETPFYVSAYRPGNISGTSARR